jgi:hypothetical protein
MHALTAGGSALAVGSGLATAVYAQAHDLPRGYAFGGLFVGLAGLITAAMPAILRVVHWKVDEAREDRKARQERADFAGEVKATRARLDYFLALLGRYLRLVRAERDEQLRTLAIDREWMVRAELWMQRAARLLADAGLAGDDDPLPLPPDFRHRAFDVPGVRREMDLLLADLEPGGPARPGPDPDGA